MNRNVSIKRKGIGGAMLLALFALAVVLLGGNSQNAHATQGVKQPPRPWFVGGNPFVAGGVHTTGELNNLLASAKGKGGMMALGASAAQANYAATRAKIKECRWYNWQVASAMLSGGGVVHNLILAKSSRYYAGGVPSFCFSVPTGTTVDPMVKSAEKIVKQVKNKDGSTTTTYAWTETTTTWTFYQKYAVPMPCGNIAPTFKWKTHRDMVVRRTRTKTTQGKPKPPVAKPASATLAKTATVNGSAVNLVGNEFTFSVSVNGTEMAPVKNAATGSVTNLGKFKAGDKVEVCETDSAGFTPDKQCDSHTMLAGETYRFSWSNSKTVVTPSYSCEILNWKMVPNPNSHTVVITTKVTGGVPVDGSTIDWGDKSTKDKAFKNPASHEYNHDGVYNIIVYLQFAGGGTATCNTQIHWPPVTTPPVKYQCTASFTKDKIKFGDDVTLIVNPNGPAVHTRIDWSDGAYNEVGDGGYQPNEPGPFSGTATVTYDNGTTSQCGDTVEVIKKDKPPKPDCKDKGPGWSWDEDKGECTCPPDKGDKPDKGDHGKGDRGDKGSGQDGGGYSDNDEDEGDQGGEDS